MRELRRFAISFAAIAMMVAFFQNCSGQHGQIVFSSSSSSSSSRVNSGGNGDFYGGKPDFGTYLRVLTHAVCETAQTLLGKIVVDANGIQLDAIDPKSCTALTHLLEPLHLEFSRYNPRYIGVAEDVYFRPEEDLGKRNSLRPEVWCRRPGSTSSTGFDVVVERETLGGELFATTYTGSVDATAQPIFTRSVSSRVLQSLGGARVEYSSPEFFLEIGAPLTPGALKFPGRLHARSETVELIEPLDCRLAGSLDPADPAVAPLAWPIPGKVEMEDYDVGGEGIGYHDSTPGDQGGFGTRKDDVDIVSITRGFGIGFVEAGEWLNYTLNASSDGLYEITIGIDRSMATTSPSLHFELDGVDVTGPVQIPLIGNTPGFYPSVTFPRLNVSKGIHRLRLVVEQGGFSMNHMTFGLVAP